MTERQQEIQKKQHDMSSSIKFSWGAYLTIVNHLASIYAIPLLWNHPYFTRLAWELVLLYRIIGTVGITLGSHRYWSHRSFQMDLPLQIFFMLLQSMSLQGSIFWWARDHRSHHKHENTAADPYNAQRGMLYAHIGWIFLEKNPAIAKHPVNVEDLKADPVVSFQRRYYLPLALTMCYGVPALYGHICSHLDVTTAVLVLGCLRWVICSHATWIVNSLCHSGPEGAAVNTYVAALFAGGEGYHEFHHKYPYDAFGAPRSTCSAVEAWLWNPNGVFLDFLIWTGLVYGQKSVSSKTVLKEKGM